MLSRPISSILSGRVRSGVGSTIAALGAVLLLSSPAQSQSRLCLRPDAASQQLYLPPFAGRVQTSLSGADLRSAGDCLLTRDSQTGLEWLNISLTTRQSYDSITAGFGGYLSQGFRVASRSEVEGLIANSIATITREDGSSIKRSLFPESIGFTLAVFDEVPGFTGDAFFGSPDDRGRVSQFYYQGFGSLDALSGVQSSNMLVQLSDGAISRSSEGIYRGALLVRENGTPPGGGIRNGEANAPEAIPTPALLPGIIGFVAAMRKRMKQEAES
jgi:hypothetical protein